MDKELNSEKYGMVVCPVCDGCGHIRSPGDVKVCQDCGAFGFIRKEAPNAAAIHLKNQLGE